jgi:hypothetical protein
VKLRTLGVLALCLAAISSAAADHEFKSVLKAVEKQYGIHHRRMPFVSLILKFYHPEGIHELSFAVIENLDGKVTVSVADLDDIVSHNLGSNWQPMVRTKSRRDNESTVVYVDTSSSDVRMFVATIERDEATIVKLSVPETAMREWFDEPARARKNSLLGW